ncbi:MAG: MarR family transcriptional regulator [Burkholderiales bacterium]|nr:MarR family transcriptional regulator [Burkholderiales bacterium]
MNDDNGAMELEDHLFFLCTQVVYRRNSLMQEVLRPLDLSPPQYRILSAVLRKGPLTMLELAQWTAFERTRITHMLHAMEERGLVVRTSLERDRRTVLVQVTAEGSALFRRANKLVNALTDEITGVNSEEEVEAARAALRRMRLKLIELGT